MRESIACLIIGLVTGVAVTLTQWPDSPEGLIIDDVTGCHYIVGPGGGITPRLTAPQAGQSHGWHICSGERGGDYAAWAAQTEEGTADAN